MQNVEAHCAVMVGARPRTEQCNGVGRLAGLSLCARFSGCASNPRAGAVVGTDLINIDAAMVLRHLLACYDSHPVELLVRQSKHSASAISGLLLMRH